MSSLYKRATPSQFRMLRAIAGAVKNSVDAHPDWRQMPPRIFARSIAKRATGTLTAQWPDVLAAKPSTRSISGERDTCTPPHRRASHRSRGREGEGLRLVRLSPLRRAWKQLSYEAGMSKRSGNLSRMALVVEALKAIAALETFDRESAS